VTTDYFDVTSPYVYTLFLLYINDVADIFTDLTASLSLFADDLKLYTDYTVDATHSDLQVAIDRLIKWAKNGNCRYQFLSAQHFVLIIHSGT